MRDADGRRFRRSPLLRRFSLARYPPCLPWNNRLRPAEQMPDQRHQKQNQENEEQDFCDACGCNGNTGETEQRSHQRNDEKRQRPTQHRNLLTGGT